MDPTITASIITAVATVIGVLITVVWNKPHTGATADREITRQPAQHTASDEFNHADVVAEAERRLAEMPLDKVPDSAPLPQNSRVLFGHNPLFVGREEELKDLAKILRGDSADSQGRC
jgi:Flp pilus assembly protein CpaB